jgi:hypothetical protein
LIYAKGLTEREELLLESVAEKTGVEFPTSKTQKNKLMKFYEKTNPELIKQVSSTELGEEDFYRKSTPARMFRTESDYRLANSEWRISGRASHSNTCTVATVKSY